LGYIPRKEQIIMAALSIPKEHKAGIALIAKLSDASTDALAKALERSPSATPNIDGVSEADAERMVDAVKFLTYIRSFFDVPMEQFLDDIYESVREDDELRNFATGNEKTLHNHFEKLLGVRSLVIATKAMALRREHEHTFCEARIFTDARPIYAESVNEVPAAVVITHMLKLAYHDSTPEVKEIYIALDSDELIELKQAVERAETKHQSLTTMFKGANVPVFDEGESN
jgi:hypothetical protein